MKLPLEKIRASALLWLVIASVVHAQDDLVCSQFSELLSFAGPPSVQALVNAWKEGYAQVCPDATQGMTIEGESSADGAARVCGTRTGESPVDMGGLSRLLQNAEAKTEDGWQYDCQRSRRTSILVEVAVEGLSVFVKNSGPAQECLQLLGGLTMDQLRWMYSSFSINELKASGTWDPAAVPYSDDDDDTHLWSELFHECEPVEIQIAGEPQGSLSHKYFVDTLLTSAREGETTRSTSNLQNVGFNTTNKVSTYMDFHSNSDVRHLIQYLDDNDSAISFMGLGYSLSKDIRPLLGSLEAVPVQNGHGEYTKGDFAAIEDSKYALSRRLYISVNNAEYSLGNARSFLDFGYTETGSNLLKEQGFWPIHDWEKVVMRTRLQTQLGIPMERIQQACGPPGGKINIAGSSTVFPVVQLWAAIYYLACDVEFLEIGRYGSSVGAARVCGNLEIGTPVDIGNMSRDWKSSEAAIDGANDFLYNCLEGDEDRSAIQIDAARDGVAIVTQRGGPAWKCIDLLGGLTMDQLRWIFTSYTDSELEETGWDPACLKNSDGNSATHLWSEIDERCDRVEIRLAGVDSTRGTFAIVSSAILSEYSNGESFGTNRPFGYFESAHQEDLVAFLNEYGEAITYTSYTFYYEFGSSLAAVSIEHEPGNYVAPSFEAIGDGSYSKLSRTIYINVLNDAASLVHTAPFVMFGLDSSDLVAVTGNVPIVNADVMHNRIDNAPYNQDSGTESARGLTDATWVGIIVGAGLTVFYGILAFMVYRYCFRGSQ